MKFCESPQQNTQHIFWFKFHTGDGFISTQFINGIGGDKINDGFAEFLIILLVAWGQRIFNENW